MNSFSLYRADYKLMRKFHISFIIVSSLQDLKEVPTRASGTKGADISVLDVLQHWVPYGEELLRVAGQVISQPLNM